MRSLLHQTEVEPGNHSKQHEAAHPQQAGCRGGSVKKKEENLEAQGKGFHKGV